LANHEPVFETRTFFESTGFWQTSRLEAMPVAEFKLETDLG
jgi:hypothetical protein